ncbi:MAG: family 16 glycosylhydrolase [Bryobacteraceae bacterium]
MKTFGVAALLAAVAGISGCAKPPVKEAGAVEAVRKQKPAARSWTRTGSLGEIPKPITDAYPLSDQGNKGGWIQFEPLTDEFEGKTLDLKKWRLGIVGWNGRNPAMFSPKNITVSDGKLHLTMRKEKLPPEYEQQGFHDYSSAALHSTALAHYGYYEIKAKPMNSGGSSAFWFAIDYDGKWGPISEIDVFEICGRPRDGKNIYNMSLHAYKDGPRRIDYLEPGPDSNEHFELHGQWEAPWRFADGYHVYGFEWGRDEVRYYVDGVVVRTVENLRWHDPLHLTLDSETFPFWFGMPEDRDLPSTFSIEYVRAWISGSPGKRQAAN